MVYYDETTGQYVNDQNQNPPGWFAPLAPGVDPGTLPPNDMTPNGMPPTNTNTPPPPTNTAVDWWKDRNKNPTSEHNPGDGWEWYWSDPDGEWKARRVGGGGPGPTPTPTPTETTQPVSNGSIGGTPFDFPAYENAPVFDYPAFQEKFTYDKFKPSSWADAENEPGYQASRDQLKKQVEAGAAYRGVVRSGMTIGDVYKNLDSQAQQNFSGFDQRNFRNWQAGKDLALDTYGTKFGAWQGNRDNAKMSYDSIWNNTNAKNNYQYNVASEKFRDLLDRWKTQVQSLTSIAVAGNN